MDAITGFFAFLRDLWLALWAAITALGGALWWVMKTYPTLGAIITVAAVAFFIYWFADGVKNWRKKCIPCRGNGAFNSKISSRLNRPCACCAGSVAGGGRHPTIRSRIWGRVRGTKR